MSNDNHITYLFGAGASYNSMPVVNELNDDIRRLDPAEPSNTKSLLPASFSIKSNGKLAKSRVIRSAPWIKPVQERVHAMMSHIDSFTTVDTLAKFWTATRNDNLPRLKEVINLYFAMRHFCPSITISKWRSSYDERRQKEIYRSKLRFDPRYDALIAGLVSAKDGRHNERVSYISYNYDLELEQSLLKFGLNAPKGEDGEIPIYHVNGHCTNLYGGVAKDEEQTVKAILDDGGAIKYAWEADEISKEEIRTRLANTTHLVVIGYSFPVFNREIDRQILAAEKLVKIYIQDLPKALPGIENRVKALLGQRANYAMRERANEMSRAGIDIGDKARKALLDLVEIETINSTDQFHIPFELI